MTQTNPLPTKEKIASDVQLQRKFWGVIAISVMAFLAYSYVLSSLLRLESTPAIYIKMAVYAIAIALAVTSFTLAIRRKVDLALTIIFYYLLIALVAGPATTQGRTLYSTFAMLVVGILMIGWLLPRSAWHRNAAFLAGAFILAWAFEWINPPWRIVTGTAVVGPIVAIVFTLILVVLVVREAWNRNNIRSRFLTLSLGLTLLASVIIAVISVNSLFSAGEQAQKVSSQALRSQVQDFLSHQTIETAAKNDLILQGISQDAQDVAQQAAYILENPNAFNTELLWKAEEHMFVGSGGQYINGANDTSTVFIPNTVTIDDNLKHRLETLAFLDMAFIPVYDSDPNSVAIYFVGRGEISWFYPNINLGSFIPPDYLATQDIFYTSGAPENNPERQVVWTPVYDDPAGQGLLVSAIAPVYVGDTFEGVIGIDVSLANLTANIETEDFGSEGTYAFLLDSEDRALALPEQGYINLLGRGRQPGEFGVDFANSAQSEFASILDHIHTNPTGFHSVVIDDQEYLVAHAQLTSTNWTLVSVANAAQVLAPATTLRTELAESSSALVFQRILPIGVVIVILVLIAGYYFTNVLAKPLEQLTVGAAKIGVGEWDAELPKSEIVEIDGLSHTLSAMAAQLKETLGTLEQRVVDRTRNLELAAEVGRSVSQVRALDVMLKDACQLILDEFDLYYVQVYLTDPSKRDLVLEAGTGEVGAQLLGRGHSLPLNKDSINGRAAVEKSTVLISDTAQSVTFHPNPLLPETRGEMAVPLTVGENVVGVLDVQTRYPGKLTEEVLPAFEALAGQVAVAIQNAKLVAEAEAARAEVEKRAARLVRTSWGEHLDAIHKPEQIGFVFDRNEVTPLVESEEAELPEDDKTVSVPIAITGEPLGSLVVEVEDETRKERTSELVTIVARQVAQQIENLRLLESADRYRHEAEEAARRQTVEGWQAYLASRTADHLGYMYDLNEVRPHSNGQDDVNALTLPLKARDEKVGKLSVHGLSPNDRESFELATAVAERLGAHIESLRLFEETRRGQVELDKRAQQLAAVAKVSTASSQELDVQKMLATVVHLTQRQFGLYHAHVFTYNEANEELAIVACGYKEGDEHEGTHGTSKIPLSQEQSLVARAARTRQAVMVNDVHNEPGWLPNPLLPETLSELAVPLLIGDTLLGVLDVQSEYLNHFTEEDANIQLTLASQVAIALQNAYSYAQAQKQAERESMLNTINQKIQSATSVEAVLQIAARELGHALGAPMTIAQLSIKDQN